MFTVIYRTHVKLGQEEEYKSLWHQIARYFVKERGALGSKLNFCDEGYFVAYSRWPDRATRDASWRGEGEIPQDLPVEIHKAIVKIKSCVDINRTFNEITMTLIDSVDPD